ncbi:14454_t:CDS:2 [Entrophospora sp. SA101]|nr:14454_t:CDS:2 [Entrophospora sp. SA101]
MDLVNEYSSSEDETISTSLQVAKRQKIDLAPQVTLEDLKLTRSIYTKPTDTEIGFNIPYDDMMKPMTGPQNPFNTKIMNKNVLTGHVEEQAYSEATFKTQQRTFTSFGYALDPSLIGNPVGSGAASGGVGSGVAGTGYVGDIEKAIANKGVTVYDSTPKSSNTPKRKPKGDSSILEGDNAYQGPWAGYEGENIGNPVGPPEVISMIRLLKMYGKNLF